MFEFWMDWTAEMKPANLSLYLINWFWTELKSFDLLTAYTAYEGQFVCEVKEL